MKFTTSNAATLALVSLLQTVNAHMVMTKPMPFNFGTLPNAPLSAEAPFPCKFGGANPMPSGQRAANLDVTQVSSGSTTEVSFEGSATHGGGVCQFSVTYETPGTEEFKDPANWKVLHTIIGGCPAETVGNIEANLPSPAVDSFGHALGPQCQGGEKSTGTECVRSFDIPFPKGLPNGEATFAWTWFNKIGNREMYMNCAPITVSGGSDGDTSVLDGLPQIFVANADSGATNTKVADCKTADGSYILNIPQSFRGQSVVENDSIDPRFAGVGSCSSEAPSGGASGGAGPSDPPASTPTAAPIASPSVPSTPVAEQPPANDGGNFAEQPEPTVVAPVPSPSTPAAQPPVPSPSTPAAQPPAAGGSTEGPAGSVACTNEGGIVCMDNSQWGLCNHGFAVPQALAAGTVCENTTINATPMRRHVYRHLRAHPRSFR